MQGRLVLLIRCIEACIKIFKTTISTTNKKYRVFILVLLKADQLVLQINAEHSRSQYLKYSNLITKLNGTLKLTIHYHIYCDGRERGRDARNKRTDHL